MSEAKHTPGPWVVQYGHQTGYPRGIGAIKDKGVKGAVGCVVRFNGIGFPSSEAGRANANLIAAAPALLEALLGCVAAIERTAHCTEAERLAAADKARAAIAKALGEQS
jgi:hypothetical protein